MTPPRHLWLLTTAVVAPALVGCGAGSGQRRAVRPAPPSTFVETQAARAVEAVALHASLPFSGGAVRGAVPESREFVTVDGLLDPMTVAGGKLRPPAGTRLLAVRLTIESIAGPAYRDDPGREVSLVSETTGGYVGRPVAYKGRARGCELNLVRTITLAAGARVSGCVFFRVPAPTRITAVQYQTEGGAGANRATWAVNRFDVHG